MLNLRYGFEDTGAWVEAVVKRFINESAENTLRNEENERAWADPLVGFSNGADPLYRFYKEDIGDFFLSPQELFAHAYPDVNAAPKQLTVISWILPQTDAIKSEHRQQTRFPTERWARSRIYGEEVNNKLRRHVVAKLKEVECEAVAPTLSPLWGTREHDKYVIVSNWSERHAAYAAGLGTFGLCDGLITPKGKAMRCGSVIARIDITPSPRPYSGPYEYCLFRSKGMCGECVHRCPAGAISESGHDKVRCREYLDMTRQYVRTHYGFEGYGCGLCQTGVRCESGIPAGD
ncbi:MAG: epoxyqueuosine reductase [Candidatus Bathyarchaeota archaeon]|nr:epoxyqueuosine reductase [Candidatus Bathyarchaeota archaeon]